MKTVFIAALITILALSGAAIAFAEDGEEPFVPFFGKGEHASWDETTVGNVTITGFGSTYGYYATPTDYGWFTSVTAQGAFSNLSFACYYNEENDSVTMTTGFTMKTGLLFSQEEVEGSVVIGENEPIEFTYFRRESNHRILEERVSGFDLSRASETFTTLIGPFAFEHNIKGLFDVPAARNLIWCDDRE